MDPRVTEYEWEPNERFFHRVTNPLGWITEYSYWSVLGAVKSKKDVTNNLPATTYEYDNFGRITKTTLPDGNYEEIDHSWDIGSSFPESLYYIESTGSNQPPVQKWFNGMSQRFLDRYKNRNNQWVFEETVYNDRGEIWKESLPYFSGGQKYWTEYVYDVFGRVVELNTPTSNIETSYIHSSSGLTQTTVNNSSSPPQQTSKTLDGTGLTISSTDDGGTITYAYNSWGRPREIAGPASVTTMTYDLSSGQQLTLDDPASGTTNYNYNAAGELTNQTDAEGNTFEMTYDRLGRMLSRYGPDGSYTYTYDMDFVGALDKIESPYNTSVLYEYDALGRKTKFTEDIQGKLFEFNYTYDPGTGSLTGIEYPNRLEIERTFDANGYLTHINKKDDSELLWEFLDENQLGQITEYKLGNNITVTRTNDQITGVPNTHTNTSGLSYQYDFEGSTGNLISRSNTTHSLSEDFTYDVLNRLEQENVSGLGAVNLVYSNTGDIESKDHVGDYTNDYATGRTEQITNNPNTISDNSQVISYTPFNSVSPKYMTKFGRH